MSRTYHHGSWNKPWVKRPIGAYWASVTPSWWTRLFMNRPKRAAIHHLERKIVTEGVDVDNVPFPLGSRKPHNYYW